MFMNAKDKQSEESNCVSGLASGKLEELHLIVSKEVANDFRHVAKKVRKPPHELLEEMLEIYKSGL